MFIGQRLDTAAATSVVGCALAALLLSGCGGAESRVEVPNLDPAGAAQAAMQQFDANHDGELDEAELQKAPGLIDNPAMPVKLIDRNSDNKVSAKEIQDRIQKWIDDKVGLMTLPVSVTLDGKPLADATVTFVPEPFLADVIEPAAGVTDALGMTTLAIDSSKLPSDMAGRKCVRAGFYRVEITHPTKSLPARYNTETTLGQEVSNESLGALNVAYDLTSR